MPLAVIVRLPLRAGQRRVDDVVLERLVAALARDLLELALHLLRVLLALADRLDVEVVQGDTPLEQPGEQRVVDGLPEVERRPPLLAGHPQDAVADVVVVAEHVGELVVHVVVRVLPLLGRLGGVPLPVGGVDLRVVHPVPLAVHDVVADLHVLEDLVEPEERARRAPTPGLAGRSCDWVPTSRVSRPATARPRWIWIIRLMYAASDAPRDSSISARIASSSRPELLDVLLGEVGVLLDVGDGHVGPLGCQMFEGARRRRRRRRRSAPARWAGRTRRRCAGRASSRRPW